MSKSHPSFWHRGHRGDAPPPRVAAQHLLLDPAPRRKSNTTTCFFFKGVYVWVQHLIGCSIFHFSAEAMLWNWRRALLQIAANAEHSIRARIQIGPSHAVSATSPPSRMTLATMRTACGKSSLRGCNHMQNQVKSSVSCIPLMICTISEYFWSNRVYSVWFGLRRHPNMSQLCASPSVTGPQTPSLAIITKQSWTSAGLGTQSDGTIWNQLMEDAPKKKTSQNLCKSSHIVLAQWPTVSPTSYTFKQSVNATLKTWNQNRLETYYPPTHQKFSSQTNI